MNKATIRTIKQQEYDYQEYNNYNNNYNNHTEPGVFMITADDAERICKAYNSAIGVLNGTVAAMIESAVKGGLTVDNIIQAINETAFAPRPSAAYLRAILRNWLKNGVSCGNNRAASPAGSWWQRSNPALQYQQREYNNDDFDGDAFMQEARRMMKGDPKP